MAYSRADQSLCSVYSVLSNWSLAGDFIKHHNYPVRICFVGEVTCDMLEAAEAFNFPVVTSETGQEFIDDNQTLLVFNSFDCDAYDNIVQLNLKGRIMGAPALIEAAEKDLPLPLQARPILSLTMKDVVVCFSGIRDKSEAMELMYMIRCMGGSVRQEPGRWVTHLIAGKTSGPKYDYANVFGVPAMSPEWVRQCWKRRYLPGYHATDEELMAYRQQPFLDCHAAFLGFSANEEITAMKVFVSNGGEFSHPFDSKCTHVIVDDQTKCSIPNTLPSKCLIVRSEWLWKCVQQIMRAPEESYLIQLQAVEKSKSVLRKRPLQPCVGSSENEENASDSTSLSHTRYSIASAASNDGSEYGATPAKLKKIDTSISGIKPLDNTAPDDESNLQVSHITPTESDENLPLSSDSGIETVTKERSPVAKSCRRSASFLELLQTEDNYVKILDTILGIKEETVNKDQPGGALLTETEAKAIFSDVTPIFEAHSAILQDLRKVQRLWDESPSIGDVYSQISSELRKSYAPFIRNFEKSKEMVQECEEKKPRFHAFTKLIRGRPDCGRQTLPDLMIRPVQRLGSTVLLLREIKKHTPSTHPDFIKLQSALECLSEVLVIINEDKRRMETLCSVFDVFNLIEYCPADIIASHRSLVIQTEAVQLTEDGPSQVGDHIMLFIFTDVLLFAKKKSKVVAMMSKPSEELTDKILKLSHGKPYKFLEVVPHTSVKRLLNVVDNQNVRNVFAVVTRGQDELRESNFSFRLLEGIGEKSVLLESWCRAIASHTCTADPNSYLMTISAEQCGLTSSDVEETQIKKASRMMVKTQCLLGSVFGKGGASSSKKKVRTPSFNINGIQSPAFRSPSCSNLTDEMLVVEKTQELKTSSLTHNVVMKL